MPTEGDSHMKTIDDERLAELQAKYPAWDIWHVRALYGPGAWCVKPADTRIATHQEDSADELDEWLSEQP